MAPSSIDLNADLGETLGDYIDLLPVITTANIACGGHAGGGQLLIDAVRAAIDHKVQIGAHPSYPDREGFGRVSMRGQLDPALLKTLITEQIQELKNEVEKQGSTLSHIKAHGALYNDAMTHSDVAAILVQVAKETTPGIPLLGLPNSELEKTALANHVPFVAEGYMDRAYTPEGKLVPRATVGAVLQHDEAIEQVMQIAMSQSVITSDGTTIAMQVLTVCVHADTPDAAKTAADVRRKLTDIGIAVSPFRL